MGQQPSTDAVYFIKYDKPPRLFKNTNYITHIILLNYENYKHAKKACGYDIKYLYVRSSFGTRYRLATLKENRSCGVLNNWAEFRDIYRSTGYECEIYDYLPNDPKYDEIRLDILGHPGTNYYKMQDRTSCSYIINCQNKIAIVCSNKFPSSYYLADGIFSSYRKFITIVDTELDWLPEGTTHLMIASRKFSHSLDKLPSTMLSLCIYGCTFNGSLDHLPKETMSLHLHNIIGFAQLLYNLPESMQYVFLHYHPMYPCKNVCPKTESTLILHENYFPKNAIVEATSDLWSLPRIEDVKIPPEYNIMTYPPKSRFDGNSVSDLITRSYDVLN